MVLTEEIKVKELETEGYIHIKSFFSDEEITAFKEDFESKKNEASINSNYHVPSISSHTIYHIKEKMDIILKKSQELGVNADILEGGAYFSTKGGQTFPWHQDHDSYYTCQNHTDYLNFYFPLIKPEKSKSNVTLVPYSVLKEKSFELYNKVKGKGAIGYAVDEKNKKTYVNDDNKGKQIHKLDYDIGSIAVTPELEVGDLLLMRGDLIHQTQDADSQRVAASIRVLNSKHLVSYQKLINCCSTKVRMMHGNQNTYNYMISAFRTLNKEKISIGEFLTTRYNLKVRNLKSKFLYSMFLKYLKVEYFFKKKNMA